jgi:uncharacterized protein (TIGR02300 family)
MASKQARGTKRTCQNDECGARFYDLGRTPIVCPICEEVYQLASSPIAVAAQTEDKARPRSKKPEFAAEKAARPEAVEAEADDALPEIEEGNEAVAAEEDETFLEEEEEEGGDLSNVIGGPVAEGEEP